MSPGPSFIVVAQSAMSHSRKKALYISLGLGLGAMIFSFLACTGLYILLKTMPMMFFAFKILGGMYLCFLSYKILKNSNKKIQTTSLHVSKETTTLKSILFGLFTQLSNPKTAIVIGGIFAAFLPTSIPEYSYIYLCLIAFFIDTGWYSIVSITLSTKKAQKAYDKYQTYINLLSGSIMGLIGIKLAISI
jgi:threonine/homoserine/homoserine lactone efflux protein